MTESEWYGRIKPLRDDPSIRGVVSWRHCRLFDDLFGPLLHQVRHPLKVIGSSQTLTNDSFRFMFKATGVPKLWHLQLHLRRYIKRVEEKNLLRWTMYTWLNWNRMIGRDPRVVHRYRVEDIEREWPVLLEKAGLDPVPCPRLEKDVNTREGKYSAVDWNDLEKVAPDLAGLVRQQAEEYGYA